MSLIYRQSSLTRQLAAVCLVGIALLLAACSESEPPVSRYQAPPPRTPIEVRSADVVADLYLPDGTGPHPGVVVLGGSEGGLGSSGRIASALADEGFVALAVGYFALPDLPPQLVSIPLERFDSAIDWLKQRPDVADGKVALVGASKGAEAALLVAAARSDLTAVVAATPTHVAWQGLDMATWSDVPSWTRAGVAVAYVRYDNQGPPWPLVELYARSLRNVEAVAAARIKVADIRAPLLLISGQQDQMWPAYAMASDIVQQIKVARPEAIVEHLSYADAGHAVLGRPFNPDDPKVQGLLQLGGTLEGNLQARTDGWPKFIAFLRAYR